MSTNRVKEALPNPNDPMPRVSAMVANESVSPQQAQEAGTEQKQVPPQFVGGGQPAPQDTQAKKRVSLLKILIIVLVLAVLAGGVVFAYNYFIIGSKQVVAVEEETGKYALDTYKNLIINYDAEKLVKELESSHLASEWDFANENKVIQSWIKSVCSYVDFTYPKVKALNNRGEFFTDATGTVIMVDSTMNSSEDKVIVTHIDYSALSATMEEDSTLIKEMYTKSGYAPTDYTYTDEMRDLMLDYLLSKSNYPTKTTELSIPLKSVTLKRDNADGTQTEYTGYKVSDDAVLDDILFGSDDFHAMIDKFALITTGVDMTQEGKSESVITYTWVGSNFVVNKYEGALEKVAPEGDGTFDKPAGLGTPIVTKVLGTDGAYHDVKVTLIGYWQGQSAIDYAVGFSEKNRGFSADSVIKLVCFEVRVENLENAPITISSELYLGDSRSNQSTRTGSMYGFYDTATIQPHKKVVLNDWATSTELDQKYVCWGKTFLRKYPCVWFKLLAGSGGEVPKYNANKSVVNKHSEEETTTVVEVMTEPTKTVTVTN